MAKINGQDVLFGARINITGSGAGGYVILPVASRPETNINTNVFYRIDNDLHWYDGTEWRVILNVGDIIDELNATCLYVNAEAIFGDNDQVTIDSSGITVNTNVDDESVSVKIGNKNGIEINGKKVLVEGDATGGSDVDVSDKLDANGWSTSMSGAGSLTYSEGSRIFRLDEEGVYRANDTTQEEINLKFPNKSGTFATEETVTEKVAEVVASAPEDFDTLKEMSDWIATHGGDASKMNTDIKANADAITAEVTRAKSAEKVNSDAITALGSRVTNLEKNDEGYLTEVPEEYINDTELQNALANVKAIVDADDFPAEGKNVLYRIPYKGQTSLWWFDATASRWERVMETTDVGVKQDKLSFDGTYDKDTNKVATVQTVTDALSGKQDVLSFDGTYNKDTNKVATVKTVTDKVAEIVSDAPADFDTLKEMSDWIATHGGDASKMNTDIKANADAIKELQDAGYLTSYTESDPTVPDWAKAEKKPTYTAEEVGALPSTTVIPTVPTKVSAFENDKGYLTTHQDISGKQDVLSFDGTYNKDTNKVATVQTVTDKVAEVVASAPEDFDTLKEMSDWISSHSTSAAQMNSKITTNGNRITGLINRIDNFSYNELKDKPFDGADTFTELFATDYVSFTQQTTYSVYTILNPTFNIEIGKKYKILIHDPQREEVLAELVTEASEDQGGYTVLGTYGDTLYAEYDMAGMTILYKGTVSYMVVSVQEYKPINLSYVDIKFDGTYNASTNKVATVQTVTNKIAQVVAGAPASFDTLKEMSDWMSAHASSAASMNSLISTNKTNISTNASNISDHDTRISTNASNISAHNTRITALESTIGNIETLLADIEALQNDYISGGVS